MQFNLISAIITPYYRTGRRFEFSQPVLDVVNERIDRLRQQQAASMPAREGQEAAACAS